MLIMVRRTSFDRMRFRKNLKEHRELLSKRADAGLLFQLLTACFAGIFSAASGMRSRLVLDRKGWIFPATASSIKR
jgi:hypothetical protein